MKSSIVFLMLCALTGCVQQKNALPVVSGSVEPVNSPALIKELNNVR